jgi:hypothetical protein
MRKTFLFLVSLLLVLGFAGVASAGLVNPGFETGNFTGWTVNDSTLTGVVTGATTYQGYPIAPKAGTYFASAKAGLGVDVPTTISQTVSLAAGETVQGWAKYAAHDYYPFNDYAYVSVNGSNVWYADTASVGDYGFTDWDLWSFTAPVAGSYTFVYAVVNAIDNALSSYAYFDAAAAPIPGTVWLLGSAFVYLASRRRRK